MTYETSDGMVFDCLADAMTHETGTDRPGRIMPP